MEAFSKSLSLFHPLITILAKINRTSAFSKGNSEAQVHRPLKRVDLVPEAPTRVGSREGITRHGLSLYNKLREWPLKPMTWHFGELALNQLH
jgi:hypothetical protein